MNVLLAHALEQECGLIQLEGHDLRFCCTGVGKVQAGLAVSDAIHACRPDVVINLGSSGALHHEVGRILMCTRFIDRDLRKVAIPGVCDTLEFTSLFQQSGWLQGYDFNATVSTGDSFVTSETDMGPKVDVVDMEAFGIACACQRHGLPLISIKYVTDIVGQNSLKAWAEKLSAAKDGLEAYLNALRLTH